MAVVSTQNTRFTNWRMSDRGTAMLKGCGQGIGVEPVVKYGNVKREGRSYTSEVWEGKMCIVMCVCVWRECV